MQIIQRQLSMHSNLRSALSPSIDRMWPSDILELITKQSLKVAADE
jgi:hypothetical protein